MVRTNTILIIVIIPNLLDLDINFLRYIGIGQISDLSLFINSRLTISFCVVDTLNICCILNPDIYDLFFSLIDRKTGHHLCPMIIFIQNKVLCLNFLVSIKGLRRNEFLCAFFSNLFHQRYLNGSRSEASTVVIIIPNLKHCTRSRLGIIGVGDGNFTCFFIDLISADRIALRNHLNPAVGLKYSVHIQRKS